MHRVRMSETAIVDTTPSPLLTPLRISNSSHILCPRERMTALASRLLASSCHVTREADWSLPFTFRCKFHEPAVLLPIPIGFLSSGQDLDLLSLPFCSRSFGDREFGLFRRDRLLDGFGLLFQLEFLPSSLPGLLRCRFRKDGEAGGKLGRRQELRRREPGRREFGSSAGSWRLGSCESRSRCDRIRSDQLES